MAPPVSEEWPFDMGYSYARLKDTLDIFRAAEKQDEIEDASRNIDKLLREKSHRESLFKLDQPAANRGAAQVSDNDQDDNDDDHSYNPAVSSAQLKNKKSKRKADSAPEGESPKKTTKASTRVLPKEERPTDQNAYITLALTSAKTRAIQEDLAVEHGNDVKDIKPENTKDHRTYTEKLDDESAQISNKGGRALRSGKIVQIVQTPKSLRCPRCNYVREDCQCHRALMPRQETPDYDKEEDATTSRRRGPSVVPFGPRPSTASRSANIGLLTPSLKGKERAPSLSPPVDTLTPAPTASQENFSSGHSYPSLRVGIASPPFASPSPLRQIRHYSTGFTQDDPIVLDDDVYADMRAEEITFATRWSHPIDFRYTKQVAIKCKFCEDFRYGIHGETERVITVIKDPDSQMLRYIEIASEGTGRPDQTRMCVSCALDRLRILDCPGHVYQKMIAPQGELLENYIAQIMDRERSPEPKPLAPVCSLCVRPARVRCCGNQTHDKMRGKVAEPNSAGCGLYLCGNCRTMLDTIGGKLRKRHIEHFARQANAIWPDSIALRADAEFIFSDSLLEKAYPPKR